MSQRNDEKFLALARERFRQAAEQEREIRAEAQKDLAFVAGEQWNEKLKRDREAAGRPALTFNKLPTYVQQVANEARQNKTSIKFSPVDQGIDEETAEVFNGLARHIQYSSEATVAREMALDYSASASFGAIRLTADYCESDSFDQELKVESVPDPFSIYGIIIPAALRQKCRFAFEIESLTREEYEERYPGSQLSSINFAAEGVDDWVGEDGVRVARYWYIETERKTLQQLSDGSTRYAEDESELPPGVTVVKERGCDEDTVKSCVINGVEVLPDTETEWGGTEIPLIPVLGKQLIVNGKVKLFSVIRFARDPQSLHNFYKTTEAETVALAPRPKWIGYLGQFKTKSRDWANANLSNVAYLEADPVAINGAAAPLPRWEAFDPPVQALSIGALQSADDIKATTGIFDPSLGAQGQETSGIAIQRRQQQSSISNLHFIDNLARAERKLAEMIAECIPVYYDTARQVRILGEDESRSVALVNQQFQDPKTGKVKHHPLSATKYDLAVTLGPSYPTARLEAFDMLTQFAQAYPALLQIAGDIVFRNSDMPGATELAERFKKTLPPQLADDDEKQGQVQIPPQIQAQMQALGQQHDMLVQQVHTLTDEIQQKKLELESRERIAAMQAETQRSIALAQIDQRDGALLLQQEIAMLRARQQEQHQASMAQAQSQQQAAAADADRQHQMAMAQQAQQHQQSQNLQQAMLAMQQQAQAQPQDENEL